MEKAGVDQGAVPVGKGLVAALQQRGHGQDQAVVEAPEEVVGGQAVPDAHKKKDQDVAQGGGKRARKLGMAGFEGAAHAGNRCGQGEGIEDIVAHPGAQGNMPAAPEIAQGDGKVRTAEVGRQLDAEELGNAGHQIDAAGKIGVLLQGIHEDGDDDDAAAVALRVCEDFRDQGQGAVSQNFLFEEAPENQKEAPLIAVYVKGMGLNELPLQLLKAGNGALDELGEEGDKEKVMPRMGLRLCLAVVYVQDIACGLEGVKGDAKGQKQPEGGRFAAQKGSGHP